MSGIGKRIKEVRGERGLSLPQLAKATGLAWQTIQNLEKGKTKGSKYLLDIARALGVMPDWLERGTPPKTDKSSDTGVVDGGQKPLTTQDISIHDMLQDVPILGGASCGDDGLFELNGQVLGFARRPPKLLGIKDIYALYVSGTSMVPWREPRSLVYVHPHQPVHIGDYVVVQLAPEKGHMTGGAYIKRLVRRTAETLRLEQYNPAEEISLPMKRVKALHRVMDWSELLGL